MITGAGLEGYLATQMCFDPGTIADWLAARRAAGITLPCHLGVPGAVDPARLLSISLRLGVGVFGPLPKEESVVGIAAALPSPL